MNVPWALAGRSKLGWSSRRLCQAGFAVALLSAAACSEYDSSTEAPGQEASAELADQAIVFTALVGEQVGVAGDGPGRQTGSPG